LRPPIERRLTAELIFNAGDNHLQAKLRARAGEMRGPPLSTHCRSRKSDRICQETATLPDTAESAPCLAASAASSCSASAIPCAMCARKRRRVRICWRARSITALATRRRSPNRCAADAREECRRVPRRIQSARTALFLHRVFNDLPAEKQRMLDRLNSSDKDLVGRSQVNP
jgi:hypothetical protein